MKIMQVTVQVGRAETASEEVLVLTHCEGEALAKQDAALLDRALGGSLSKLVQSKEFEGMPTKFCCITRKVRCLRSGWCWSAWARRMKSRLRRSGKRWAQPRSVFVRRRSGPMQWCCRP